MDIDNLISVQRAIEILDRAPVNPRIERIALAESLNRRLAEDLHADRDYPPFDKSLMDGFAVRSVDTASTRRIIETVAAGSSARQSLGPDEVMAIMTGAPLPAGADAVIPVEETTRNNDQIILSKPVRRGFAIARQASDIAANHLVLSKGMRLSAVQIAVAASIGAATVSVFARPRVSVLSTGDELIEIDKAPTGSQIRNSNSHMMVALLQGLGCEIENLGIIEDDPALIRKGLATGLQSDALFVTGGMSMGERDYVPELLREIGLQIQIAKLRIKPGKPFVFATNTDGTMPKYVFGLPGNPVSAFVCTVRLAARLLSRMSGGHADPVLIHARLSDPISANGNREFYLPGTYDGSTIKPLLWKGSADIYSLAAANSLIIRPEGAPMAAEGELVWALPLWFDV